MIDLTCTAEEGMSAAQTMKESRYLPLITDIKNTRKWTVKFFTIEVGARGFVNNSFWKCCLALGMSRATTMKLCKTVSLVAANAHMHIYIYIYI